MKACKIDEIGRIVLVGDGIELLYFANKGNQFLLLKLLLTFLIISDLVTD